MSLRADAEDKAEEVLCSLLERTGDESNPNAAADWSLAAKNVAGAMAALASERSYRELAAYNARRSQY